MPTRRSRLKIRRMKSKERRTKKSGTVNDEQRYASTKEMLIERRRYSGTNEEDVKEMRC
uniref:Uncharacterized protein n=1 Tax=Cucumis melo TaxID=3656 RepID=A0A9I9DRP1_CUCME